VEEKRLAQVTGTDREEVLKRKPTARCKCKVHPHNGEEFWVILTGGSMSEQEIGSSWDSPEAAWANACSRLLASAPAPPPMETLCACSHAKGMHWHRLAGVEECGEESCMCKKFVPAPEPELCAEYVTRPTPPGAPTKAVLWTGTNLDEVHKVYPGLGVDYMLDKGCRIRDYVVCPDKGLVRFLPADRFHATYMPAPTAKKAPVQDGVVCGSYPADRG
jgi:hypothetical protein